MNIYQNFDHEEDESNNKKHKKNTFIFQSFGERIKKIKVRLPNNIQNDISFIKIENENNFKISENESNFLTIFNREKILNSTSEFIEFYNEVKPYIGSYLLIIHNASKIIKIFSSKLEDLTQIKIEGDENALNQRNYPLIKSILEVMIGFIKDIREDASEVFLSSILPNLVKLLNTSNNIEIIDKIFSVLVNIFKFLHKNIQCNFQKFFLTFSEVIFSKNKMIRKFCCESLCYLIKNLELKDLSLCLKIMFEVFISPDIVFSGYEDSMTINKETKVLSLLEMIENDQIKNSNSFINTLISKDHADLYMFIIDCISDIIFEILIGVNKNLSIRADLFLEKIFYCLNEEENKNEYLLIIKDFIVLNACIKLFTYVEDNQKKSVVSLFNFYILLFLSENNHNYSKLNSDVLKNQIDYLNFKNSISENSIKAELYTLIFIKEILLKFFDKLSNRKDKNSVDVSYFIKLFEKLNESKNLKYLGNVFTVEIISIFLKFYPEEFMSIYSKNNLLFTLLSEKFEGNILTIFFTNLKLLQNYKDFICLNTFDKKHHINIDKLYNNHDYDISYHKETLTFFYNFLLNEYNFENNLQILDAITTYEKIISNYKNLEKESEYNFRNLKLTNVKTIRIVVDFIEKDFTNINSDEGITLEKYMQIYSQIFLISFIKDEIQIASIFVTKIIEYLINLIENEKTENEEQIITNGINNREYFLLLFSEFNSSNVYYLSKKTAILNLLDSIISLFPSINLDNIQYEKILRILYQNCSNGVVYKILNNIIANTSKHDIYFHKLSQFDKSFLIKSTKILLICNNKYKSEYLKFIKFLFFDKTDDNNIHEIFTIMLDTLSILFDFRNDKKYSFNLEVLFSKIDSLLVNDNSINIYIYHIVYYFLIGSYWIRFTKSVWGVLSKIIERYFTLLNNLKGVSNRNFIFVLQSEIQTQIKDMLSMIQQFGTVEDFLVKFGENSQIINSFYLTFDNKIQINDNLRQNLINLTFTSKEDELININLLYEGFLQGLQGYYLLLTSNQEAIEDFTLFSIDCLKNSSGKNNWLDSIISQKDCLINENFVLCLFNNFILDKEHKTSVISKKLIESLLLILSKTDLSNIKSSRKILLEILYQHIILSKSQIIQKYCTSILINLESRLKAFRNLIDSVIENTNVHERLYNISNIHNDNGSLITEEERSILIPLVIRLYYSKYFYLNDDNKKIRTKNKINLVSFFTQLNKTEFDEYVKIIFEPISLSLKEEKGILYSGEENINYIKQYFSNNNGMRFYNFDIRSYKKILEILALNLKQISRLFANSVTFISYSIKTILVFVKQINNFIKLYGGSITDDNEDFFNIFLQVLENNNIDKMKYFNFYNRQEICRYVNFFQKTVKDIKKQSFLILKNIIFNFYEKSVLASNITKDLIVEYVELGNDFNFSSSSKVNSMLEYFLTLGKNPHLHFLFIENPIIFNKIVSILNDSNLENDTLNRILQFLENILVPYHNLKVESTREEYILNYKKKLNYKSLIKEDLENNNDEEFDNNVNDVEINEVEGLNKYYDMDTDLNTLLPEFIEQNEKLLIVSNFSIINSSLLSLFKNQHIKYTIKDQKTKKVLELLMYLWNMYNNDLLKEKVDNVAMINIMDFLVTLLKTDRKIFKFDNQETLGNLLKISHILFGFNEETKNENNYITFITLMSKIHENDSNNRLILSILLHEFSHFYSNLFPSSSYNDNFIELLTLITNLNLLKGKKKLLLDENPDYSNIDIDNTIDQTNLITYEFISQYKFYHLEPLLYQLLVFCKSTDYSLQTISMSKIKFVLESYNKSSNGNLNYLISMRDLSAYTETDPENKAFNRFLGVLYNSVDIKGKEVNLNNSRIVLEILSHLNSITTTKSEFICSDLHTLQLSNADYNFFEAILNIKYEIRFDAIQSLRLSMSSVSYFSLKKIIIPMIKSLLSPFTYITKGVKYKDNYNSYNVKRQEKQLENVLNESLECIPGICVKLSSENYYKDLKEFLMFFYQQIEKSNKKGNINNDEINSGSEGISKDYILNFLYKGLTKVIDSISKLFSTRFNFDHSFNDHMKSLMNEYNLVTMAQYETETNVGGGVSTENRQQTNRELFKKVFDSLSKEYYNKNNEYTLPTHADEIYHLLKNDVYRTLKYILYDQKKKEKARYYYIRNYAIKPYLQVIKMMEPHQTKYELIQLNYELINNVKNRDLSVREKAREGIQLFFESIGVYVSSMIFDELKMQLHSGYQRYIMSYTANFLINLINKTGVDNNESIRSVFDFSSCLIMPIICDELFGEVSEEKEIEQLVSKYKEAKQTKSYNSLYILCSKTNLKNAILNIIYPLWNYLIKKENDTDTFNKLNESINHIVKGLKNNENLNFEDIVVYSNGLIKIGIDINIKNSKAIRESNSKITTKGENIELNSSHRKTYQEQKNDLFTLQVGAVTGTTFTVEIANKYVNNKNEVILSNMFTTLGLEIFLIAIKKKLFDFNCLNGMSDSISTTQCVISILQNVILCLEISNTNTLSKTLKILIRLFDSKLFIIKKNLRKIVKHLFRNLNTINSQEINLSQTILSSIGDILNKFKYTSISDNKMKTLINFLKLNTNNSQIKPYVYSCFLSVVKRKILHPAIYDMINYIQETYLTAFEENTIIVCQNIIVEFLSNYPLDENRTTSYYNFFLINLESSTRKCVINSLKMIFKFFVEFYEKDIKDFMNGVLDFTILKLLTLLTNTTDADIKVLINSILEKIFEVLEQKDKLKCENYLKKILDWIKIDNETDKSLVKLSLNFLSILCNKHIDIVEKNGNNIVNILIERINSEIKIFEKELEEKLENEEFINVTGNSTGKKDLDTIIEDNHNNKTDEEFNYNNVTVLNMKFENWDILYLLLTNLEKIHKNYQNIFLKFLNKKSNEFINLIIKCIQHPHSFIKTISMRLLYSMLEREVTVKKNSQQFDFKTVEFLLSHFKIFILNSNTNDKLSNLTIENFVLLMKNTSKNNEISMKFYEILCRLYIESKSLLSNKDISTIIFERIYSLFDKIITDSDKDTVKNYLDPILSVCYRVLANRLTSINLKSHAEKILESLKNKLDSDLVANKYKEIKDNINLLKRKRKMNVLEKTLIKQKK